MAALDQAQKDKVFSVEPGQRRNPSKRQQEHQHQHSFGRSTLEQPGDVVDFVADHLPMPQGSNHREGSQIHEGVDQEIEENAAKAIDESGRRFRRRQRNHAQQDVADVRNG